jgi:hypothetical protein
MRKLLTGLVSSVLIATSIVSFSSISASAADSADSTATPTVTPTPSATTTSEAATEKKVIDGTYALGATGPGGGFIFYVDKKGFKCGRTYSKTGSPTGGLCHYLEVAPSGWNTDADDPLKVWANEIHDLDVASITNDSIAYNNPLGIGLGHKISNAIVDQGNNTLSAAGLARSYPGGSKDDWYLPTTAELNLLCQWARDVTQDVTTPCTGGTLNSGTGINGGFREYYYWSSSERPASSESVRPDAWLQFFSDGVQGESHKDGTYAVRPIRAF